MTDDLDNLRPEVRGAVETMDRLNTVNGSWNLIRAELLRFTERNAALEAKATRDFEWNTELLAANKQAEAELANVERGYEKWKRSAESVGAELAALKAAHAALQELCEGTVRANLALGHVKE